MQDVFSTHLAWLPVAAIPFVIALLIALRYLVFAGGALWLVNRFGPYLAGRRIQPLHFTRGQLFREAAWSVSTIFVFAFVLFAAFYLDHRVPLLQLYDDVDQYGWLWLAASIPIGILIHDAYFYWAHRFMHLPGVYERIHKVHHLSTNPSPLSAFAFHPVESLIEVLGLILVLMILPMHPIAFSLIALFSIITNVMGHLGYELLPARFASHPALSWINTATSHNQHHRTFRFNYGLYTLIWDRLFGTQHPQYEGLYSKVTARPVFTSPIHPDKEILS